MLLYVVLVFLLLSLRRFFYLQKFKKINGPPALPIIGNFLLLRKSFEDLNVFNFRVKYGKTVKLFFGLDPYLMTTDLNLIHTVANSPSFMTKSELYTTLLSRWLGDGLLISSGDKWRSHRKILTPAFHYNSLECFIEVFESYGKYLIDNLSSAVNLDSLDIRKVINLYTLDVICDTAMGTKVNAQINPNNEYMKSIKRYLTIGHKRSINVFYQIEWLYKCTSLYQEELKILDIITSFSRSIIEKRRKFLESHQCDSEEVDDFGKRKRMTFMDILLKSDINGRKLTIEEIREEVDTFLFEGHDTTSAAISFACYNLSKNPEVQRKVHEEVGMVLPEDGTVTLADLQNLNYLEKVIKESLRLFPSVAIHARVAQKDFDYNGSTIPKGTNVIVNQYSLHRDPDTFPDPERFDPGRFTAEEQAKRHPVSYIPFSAGHRNCIGQKFAMYEIKSALAKIVKNFEIFPVPNYKPIIISRATLFSDNGICVKLKPRIL